MVVDAWVVLSAYTVLLLVLILIFQRGMLHTDSAKQFVRLITLTLVLLVSEVFGRIGEIYPKNFLFMAKIGYFIIFLFDPLEYLVAMDYINKWMERADSKGCIVFRRAFEVFVYGNMFLVFMSTIFDNHWFYYFKGNNYYRGMFFYVRAALVMIYCLLLDLYVFIYRKRINIFYRKAILMLPVLSLFGVIGQVLIPDLEMTYAMITVGCLCVFFYLQGKDVNMDYLTGVLNRRGIDMSLTDAINQFLNKEIKFSAIMIDIDHFKSINDNFGHLEGDRILTEVAKILRLSVKNEGTIGRYGGDEFCIIINIDDKKVLKEKVTAIQKKTKEIKGEIEVSISCGYSVYEPTHYVSGKEFIMEIDELMYREKIEHHLQDRRRRTEEKPQ
ncbi:GGDEF domain-containing protein [Lachnobacterium bovis]|jgi:diguanylate cyclase (GGDEF)-like protein|uniref:Diguanylate cyclase (GGDEF) domain-containing protein n=1 Tax=Lachnobacterium bovis DSM 14045 TaxID=1122142 RepID=A0A1H3EVA3_9FIRM|nr:GGDEF domain-containing protein [Lachnobacterium bovis]MBQ1802654.1 diguanylate cyclase [Lachnobacterium sp.]SDX82666.1 diguanylate cyclase (GGDEF) domain-containing protein [Lachnobacterium bovis DSM 14045]